jgi:hypothetical protein
MKIIDSLITEGSKHELYDAILSLDDDNLLSPLHSKWFNAYAEALNGGLTQVVHNLGEAGYWDLIRGFETVSHPNATAVVQSLKLAKPDACRGLETDLVDEAENLLYSDTFVNPILELIISQYRRV